MRHIFIRLAGSLGALALIASPAFAQNTVTKKRVVPADNRLPGHEPDTYRFGLPYNTMRGTTAGQCELMCNRDDSCAAWSLAPATFSMGPRCELKRSIGSAEYRPGAVSGIAVKYQPKSPVRQQSYSQPTRVTSRGQRIITPQPRATYRPAEQPIAQPTRRVVIQPAPMTRVVPRGVPSTRNEPRVTTTPRPAPVRTVPTTRQGEPVLMGGPTPTEAERRITRAPAPKPRPTAAPVQRRPEPVMATPTPRPAPQPRPMPQQAVRPQPTPQPTAVRPAGPPPPTKPVPQFQMNPQTATRPAPAPQPQAAPKSAPAQATAPVSTGGVQIDPPPPVMQARRPWTERSNGDPEYAVQDMDFIPGDEEATAGFINGAPTE